MSADDFPSTPPKALPRDFAGRFREIVSDPLNLFIRRVPDAGFVNDDLVTLHNGHQVAVKGEEAYYNMFSQVFVTNRGVHEPLEEFVFQEMLDWLPVAPVMIELGAYWAHYSMWMKQARPSGRCIMVEPNPKGLDAGRINFARNGYQGTFEQGMIGKGLVTVDDLLRRHEIDHLDILHSDIQGFEVDMLEGAEETLAAKRISRVFVSTHSEALHALVVKSLLGHGYRIDVESEHGRHTTGHDGFVLAVHPGLARFTPDVAFMGRIEIANAPPDEIVDYVARIAAAQQAIRRNPGYTSRRTG